MIASRSANAFCHSNSVIPMLTVNVGVELELCRQVAHGDFVRLEGQLLTAGKTSVTVQVRPYADFGTALWQP